MHFFLWYFKVRILNILFILGRMFQDEHGNIVTNDAGEPLIHTGTGLISFDLAMKCPVSVFKGNFLKGHELQVPASPLSLPPLHLSTIL
jgi:hypothetical protein